MTFPSSFKPVNTNQNQQSQFPTSFKPLEKKPIEQSQSTFFEPITEQMLQDVNPETLNQRGNAFVRGGLSGLSMGASEYIPGLKKKGETGEGLGEFVGSVAPIGVALKAGKLAVTPLVNLAKKSPVMKKQLAGLANILGVGVGGAAYEGLEEAVQGKVPDAEKLAESGALWSALEVGLKGLGKLGSFTKSLISKAKSAGETPFTLLENVTNKLKGVNLKTNTPERIAELAFETLEKPLEKSTRNLSISQDVKPKSKAEMFTQEQLLKPLPESFEKQTLEKKVVPESKNYLSPEENPLINQNDLKGRIEKVATRPKTELELGERIQRDIREQKSQAEYNYRPLYNRVREVANTIPYQAQQTGNQVFNIIQRLQGYNFEPPGYGTTIRQLTGFLEDLGYTLERNEAGLITNATAPANPQTFVSNLMDLGVRLNDAINYETLEKSVKDVLKPLVNTIKQEVRQGLGSRSNLALNTFNRAESQFAETANKFGTDAITKITQSSTPEKIGESLLSPSTLKDLKNILPIGRFEQIERRVLEQLNTLSGDKAEKAFKEIQQFVSPNARKLANEIISQKKLVDFAKKFVNEAGIVDFKSFNEALKNPKFLQSIEEIGGKEAVGFVKSLENMKNKIIRNVERSKFYFEMLPKKVAQGEVQSGKAKLKEAAEIAKKPSKVKSVTGEKFEEIERSAKESSTYGKEKLQKIADREKGFKKYIEKLQEDYGINSNTKIALKVIFGISAPKLAVGYFVSNLLYKVSKKPAIRKAIRNAANSSSINPKQIIALSKSLNDEEF